jgi:hypothetical protein
MVRRGRRFESVRGLCKSAARRRFPFSPNCCDSNVRWVRSRLWSFRVQNGAPLPRLGRRKQVDGARRVARPAEFRVVLPGAAIRNRDDDGSGRRGEASLTARQSRARCELPAEMQPRPRSWCTASAPRSRLRSGPEQGGRRGQCSTRGELPEASPTIGSALVRDGWKVHRFRGGGDLHISEGGSGQEVAQLITIRESVFGAFGDGCVSADTAIQRVREGMCCGAVLDRSKTFSAGIPLGTSTRRISRRAPTRSGKNCSPNWHSTILRRSRKRMGQLAAHAPLGAQSPSCARGGVSARWWCA